MTNKTNNNDVTLVGYARVSTVEQSVQMQIDALMKFGVKKEDIYSESMSGVKKNRPAFQKAMRQLREGDTLVVWKLDRIARSINNLLEIMEDLDKRGIKFRSLTEGIETETPTGRLIIVVMGALAQFERDLIVERTRAGVKAAKERGVKFGADYKIQPKDMPKIWKQVKKQGVTMVDVAKEYDVHPQTIKRRLDQHEKEQAEAKPKRKKRAKK